jgi:hypothetical protein
VVSLIDINTRARYAGKGRPGAAPGSAIVGSPGANLQGQGSPIDDLAELPISSRLASQIRAMNSSVRHSLGSASSARPEGGAVSHTASMLQKMRVETARAHDDKGDGAASSDGFRSWHDQIEQVRQSTLSGEDKIADAGSPLPEEGPSGALCAGDEVGLDGQVTRSLWLSGERVDFPTTVTAGHQMQKDIALGCLDAHDQPADLLGRKITVNIQGVSFVCRITQDIIEASGSGAALSSILGRAFQKAIRNYALIADGDVIDAAVDGAILRIKYLAGASRPILVSAFSEASSAANLWSTDVGIAEAPSAQFRVEAAPIDGVLAEFSRSCISIRRRRFVNDNMLDLESQEPSSPIPSAFSDLACAPTVGDKRAMIQQAAMAMIKKVRQTPEPGQ